MTGGQAPWVSNFTAKTFREWNVEQRWLKPRKGGHDIPAHIAASDGRRREQGSDGRELHSRATGWFERHGRVRDAVRHAVLADDIPRAAAFIERTGGWEFVLFGGTSSMRALLDSLPFERIAEFPRIQLYHAFLYFRKLRELIGISLRFSARRLALVRDSQCFRNYVLDSRRLL
jgi:hypothetical protein